ncbi:cyclase family protein [Crateriforma conspicua]|uniref:Kynurenine formamidase n=1 Tax=Crateriforma conspicua TaxID=2527996 RepID=A0A5C6FN48_9PLAN|nr:cyclase family protein [Crateriforma conspicua]TWU60957.1 Kynurenine formamidase [Crateriforma conspicua]
MKIIDLTLTLQPGMRGVEFETKYTVERDGWNARTLHLYSHCGTHLDAPLHFEASEQTIDQIPLDRCIGKAWVVDLSDLPPKTPIEVSHLGDIAERLQPGDALLLRTLWSRHVDDAQYYRDHFQPISPDLARWMVQHHVRMVGVEPPSVADVNDLAAVTLVHQILLGGDVIIVEGLTNLDAIPGPSCTFAALPLKIHGGDGAPCRAFAMVDDE